MSTAWGYIPPQMYDFYLGKENLSMRWTSNAGWVAKDTIYVSTPSVDCEIYNTIECNYREWYDYQYDSAYWYRGYNIYNPDNFGYCIAYGYCRIGD